MMKPPRLMVTQKSCHDFTGDLLVFCAMEQKNAPPWCDNAVQDQVLPAYEMGDFSGKENQTLLFYPRQTTAATPFKAARVLVVGMGPAADMKTEGLAREALRKTGGTIAQTAEKCKAGSLMVCIPDLGTPNLETTGECLAEGIVLGDYRFTKYKKEDLDDPVFDGIQSVKFYWEHVSAPLKRGIRQGHVAARCACTARDMANEPANHWTAAHFATHAGQLAEKHGLKLSILNRADMEQMGMGGILAVNQGSVEPAKMVILEYRPAKASETLLLVGKGITFDSGGVSLKPGAGMEDMKYDMCGGAAVLSAMEAVGREKPAVGVVAIVPATDNMGGGGAVKPGDVIRHYNGTTAEIVNTDAEGRLILADALAYGIATYSPVGVVDVATLTGAAIVGLGHHYSCLLGNSDALIERLKKAGERCGEPLWQLPLNKSYRKQIESKVADIKNVGGKAAGTITAACYLEKFVDKTPWAHLDIAGTAWDFTEKTYIPKGPSGIAARTFIDLIRHWEPLEVPS